MGTYPSRRIVFRNRSTSWPVLKAEKLTRTVPVASVPPWHGQWSTVESRANRDPPLAQFLRHPAWVPAGHPEGEHAALAALLSR